MFCFLHSGFKKVFFFQSFFFNPPGKPSEIHVSFFAAALNFPKWREGSHFRSHDMVNVLVPFWVSRELRSRSQYFQNGKLFRNFCPHVFISCCCLHGIRCYCWKCRKSLAFFGTNWRKSVKREYGIHKGRVGKVQWRGCRSCLHYHVILLLKSFFFS